MKHYYRLLTLTLAFTPFQARRVKRIHIEATSSSSTKSGSVTILGDLTIHANNFATLNKKNFTSVTPLKLALNFLILALNDSAFALVSLSSKKLRILS